METIRIPEGAQVKLQVAISSDAVVATNVSLNDIIVKKSAQYKFNMELGVANELDNNGLSIVSSFFVSTGNINQIINATQAIFTVLFNDESHTIAVQKQKMSNTFFIVYAYVELSKS